MLIACIGLSLMQPMIAMEDFFSQYELNEKLFAWVHDPDRRLKSDLVAAEVKKALDAGADANAQGEVFGTEHYPGIMCTALYCAAFYGHELACRLLLEYGADVNARSGDAGSTPIMAGANHTNICKLLLDYGAQANARNDKGNCALCWAARGLNRVPNIQTCLLLLEHGVDLTAQNNSGLTPLIDAARFASTCCIRWESPSQYFRQYLRAQKSKNACIKIMQYQKRINTAIKTTLLCLNRMRNDKNTSGKMKMFASELYRQFNTLLLPHMGRYVSIKQLLEMRNNRAKRAYDYLPIDCLNPDKVDEPESGWFSKCSVQ